MRQLILASTSPRRKMLLEQTGIPFAIVASNFEEIIDPTLSPHEVVKQLSLGKAKAIAHQFTNALILAGDTIVVVNGEIIGKPKNAQHAKEILNKLSATTHMVYTGFTILDTQTKKVITDVVTAKLTLKPLTEATIDAYIATKEPFDKAGAYAIQGMGGTFVEKMEGDYAGVVGLPIKKVQKILSRFGIFRH